MSLLEEFREKRKSIKEEFKDCEMFSYEKIKSFEMQDLRELARNKVTAMGLLNSILYIQACLFEKSEEAKEEALRSYGSEYDKLFEMNHRYSNEGKALSSTLERLKEYIEEARALGHWGDADRGLSEQELRIIRERNSKYEGCIFAGTHATYGLRKDGTVVSVGRKDTVHDTSNLRGIIALSYGIALRVDGTVVSFGKYSLSPELSQWRDIIAISSTGYTTVGLKADNTVVATGSNKEGGCNTESWRDIVAVAAGGNGHTVGLSADGTVVAVGHNGYGQCDTSSWRNIVAIAASSRNTYGLKAEGTVVAVGDNEYGQCNTSSWRDIVTIAAGGCFYYVVGIRADGKVLSAGDNSSGQCDFVYDLECDLVDSVVDWNDIVAISVGWNHTVGLRSDSRVVAIGYYSDGLETDSWCGIGPPDKEKLLIQLKEDQRRWEEYQRYREEAQRYWESQGLCRNCGGILGRGYKCKSCGTKNNYPPYNTNAYGNQVSQTYSQVETHSNNLVHGQQSNYLPVQQVIPKNFCTRCGWENAGGGNFCVKCGYDLR